MITMTPKAKDEIKRLIQAKSDPSFFLRVRVKGGGCSGFTYAVDLDNQAQSSDRSFGEEGARVVCDQKSFIYLNGIEIDFSTELIGGGFHFQNPNASGSCGCGTSFSV